MRSNIFNLLKYIFNQDYRFIIDANKGKYDSLPDEEYLRRKFKARLGYDLNLDNPKTFNEKLQWLKLHDRKAIYSTMVDKYAVKKYISEIIGSQYVIPTLGVWEEANEIDFDSLPEQFVLKCTHDSRGLVICKDKSKLNFEEVKTKLNKCLSRDYYIIHREWPYKNVPRRVIAEKYMEEALLEGKQDKSIGLTDYKFHCFNGEPKVVLVCRDRFSNEGMTEDFYTSQWEHLNVSRVSHPNSKTGISAPPNISEMLNIARKLAEKIPFVRVDLYDVNGSIFFGEMTFYPASGFQTFVPNEFDLVMGEWLELPKL